jgi:hypothetical protein
MLLILSLGAVFSLVTSWSLLRLGVASMPLRWGLSVITGYLGFFLGTRMWLGYALADTPSQRAPALHWVDGLPDSVNLAFLMAPLADPGQRQRRGSSINLDLDLPADDEGAILLLVLLLLLAVVGSGIYVIVQAPAILSEAALQVALAEMLRRRARAIDTPGWTGSVFRATWKPALLLVIAVVLVGLGLQALCPGAVKLSDIL